MRRRFVGLLLAVASIATIGAACTPPAPPAPPAPDGDVVAFIHEVFGPLGQGDAAVRVARCESGLNPAATSPNGYYKGLFQLGAHIVAINNYGGDFYDYRQNTQAARDLYVSRGNNWSAWECQP